MTISIDLEQGFDARITRRFGASSQCVFDAWVDSKTAGKWLFATARGQIVCVEIDARAGGWFYIEGLAALLGESRREGAPRQQSTAMNMRCGHDERRSPVG